VDAPSNVFFFKPSTQICCKFYKSKNGILYSVAEVLKDNWSNLKKTSLVVHKEIELKIN